MNLTDIMVLDGFAYAGIKILREAGFEVNSYPDSLSEEQLLFSLNKSIKALGLRSKTQISKAAIEQNPQWLALGRAGSGVDNIDVEAATQKGIVVFNAPGANANAVAELAIFHIIGICRKASLAITGISRKQWLKKQCQGTEVSGKTLGIIGLGKIGQLVAQKALGLGMKVIGFDIDYKIKIAGVEVVTSAGLLTDSDIISLHLPLYDKTQNLINGAFLDHIRKRVHLINCARGGLVDLDAVYEALIGGKLAGYTADTFDSEPPDFSHQIFSHPNCLFTPHLGASTQEAEENCAVMIAEQFVDFLNRGDITNSVNFPAISLVQESPFRLLILHQDLAGTLEQFTKTLAGRQINISEMENKRLEKGGTAATIIDTDASINGGVIEAISKISGVYRVLTFINNQ